ncbi:hypothetical protein K413DRAFT_1241 [Clostridium sp. ASBs410]|nr:hypothetical protein K413DRAFT_1241 [Clostridium sp. ASBs410]
MGILGTVGIADKGTYNASATYVTGNSVYYEGSTWTALKDNLTGIQPEEGENWKYLARGFGSDSLSQIEGKDTSGVLGPAGANVISQALVDALADRVMTKLFPNSNIVNNGLTTQAGFALDARYGKTLKDLFDGLNSNLNDIKNVSYSVGSGIDANSCSGGIIYLLQKNSLCQIRGSITIVAALNNDSSRSIFSPEFNGQAYSPIPDGMLLTYHVRYQDITGYLSYDATTKTFKLFNYSGKTIAANSFIEIWGNYISHF